jgi:phosphoribosylanthranilate isomerase
VSAPPATKVKICGLTNLADAELAAGLGVWALGMIFYERSPRSCALEAAQEISAHLRRRVALCGVYVNAPFEDIAAHAELLALDLVQLHGDEGPAFCAEVRRRTGARVIKAAQIETAGDVRALERFRVDYHLFDAPGRTRRARGGTGETFDWSLLTARRSRVPAILGGGLDAANVAQAIAAVHPFAVDSASGTEAAPGHKDPERLRAFVEAVRATADVPPTAAPVAAAPPA